MFFKIERLNFADGHKIGSLTSEDTQRLLTIDYSQDFCKVYVTYGWTNFVDMEVASEASDSVVKDACR